LKAVSAGTPMVVVPAEPEVLHVHLYFPGHAFPAPAVLLDKKLGGSALDAGPHIDGSTTGIYWVGPGNTQKVRDSSRRCSTTFESVRNRIGFWCQRVSGSPQRRWCGTWSR
jgi:hypothetical protein